jgi:Cullin family
MYQQYSNIIEYYLNNTVVPSVTTASLQGYVVYLDEMQKQQRVYIKALKLMQQIFQYLDRFYVINMELPTLRVLGWNLYRSIIFNHFHPTTASAVNRFFTYGAMRIDTNIVEILVECIYDSSVSVQNHQENNVLHAFQELYSTLRQLWLHDPSIWHYVNEVQHSSPIVYFLNAVEFSSPKYQRIFDFVLGTVAPKIMIIIQNEILDNEVMQMSPGQVVECFYNSLYTSDQEKLYTLHRLIDWIEEKEEFDPSSAHMQDLIRHLSSVALDEWSSKQTVSLTRTRKRNFNELHDISSNDASTLIETNSVSLKRNRSFDALVNALLCDRQTHGGTF